MRKPLLQLTMAVASLHDAPNKDLVNEIKRLEELFTIDTAKLKEITHHFVDELTKGELHQRPTNGIRPKLAYEAQV